MASQFPFQLNLFEASWLRCPPPSQALNNPPLLCGVLTMTCFGTKGKAFEDHLESQSSWFSINQQGDCLGSDLIRGKQLRRKRLPCWGAQGHTPLSSQGPHILSSFPVFEVSLSSLLQWTCLTLPNSNAEVPWHLYLHSEQSHKPRSFNHFYADDSWGGSDEGLPYQSAGPYVVWAQWSRKWKTHLSKSSRKKKKRQ